MFLGPRNKHQSSGPSPDFHQWQNTGQHCSRAALRYYLTASLLQLDFDKEDEADQGDHDKESQENPHVKVFCGLLEQKTDTVSHSSLHSEDRRTGYVGPRCNQDGVPGVCMPSFPGTTWDSASTHMVCYPGPDSTLQSGWGRPAAVSARPPRSQENSGHKA